VANRSRPTPQLPLDNSIVLTTCVSNSPPAIMSSQTEPKSFLLDTMAEALTALGNDWEKWRGDDGRILASRRGVLLTLAANQAGEVVVHKERIAKEKTLSVIMKQQGHQQLLDETGSLEPCRGRREEKVLPLLAAFPCPQLLTSLFVIEKSGEEFMYRSRHCISFINSPPSNSTCCTSCNDFFENLASLENEHKATQSVRVQGEEACGEAETDLKFAEDTFTEEIAVEVEAGQHENVKLEKKVDQGVKRKRRPPNGHFACNLCEHTFRLHGGLTRHIKRVHQIKSNVKAQASFMCPHCNMIFVNQTKLQSHLLTSHDKNSLGKRVARSGEVPCPFCNDSFPIIGGRSSSHRLRHHLTTVHAKLSEMREYKDLMEEQLDMVICTHCGKSYSNQVTLNSHVKLMHNEQTEHEACHICGKRFKKGGSTLWGHIRTHEDGGHVCPICGAKFKVYI